MPDYSSTFALSSSLGYLTNAIGEMPQYYVSGVLLGADDRSLLYYYHDPERVDFSYSGSQISFLGSDRTIGPPLMIFRKPSEAITFSMSGRMPAKYIAVATWQTAKNITISTGASVPGYQYRTALFGTPSVASDPFPVFLGYSGQAMISGGIPGQESQTAMNVSAGSGTINWSYTPSSDDIFGSIPLYVSENAEQNQKGLLSARGQFDRATNSLSGTLTDRNNGFEGKFRGQMFGPERAEIAIVFEFSRVSDGSIYFGHYIGRR